MQTQHYQRQLTDVRNGISYPHRKTIDKNKPIYILPRNESFKTCFVLITRSELGYCSVLNYDDFKKFKHVYLESYWFIYSDLS